MKSVKEIKDLKSTWTESGMTSYAFCELVDAVAGIAEHLDAQQLSVEHVDLRLVEMHEQNIRREGMIAALRWVCEDCRGDKPMCDSETQARCHVLKAITRLENGGDL